MRARQTTTAESGEPARLEAHLALDLAADLGEGPVWLSDERLLLCVDITARLIHLWDPESGRQDVIPLTQMVGAVAPRQRGGLVAALEDGFWLLERGSHRPRLLARVSQDPTMRMNDGKCDPGGRFWAGQMAKDAGHRAGRLFRLEPDGNASVMLTDVTIPNGIGWSPDGDTMYFIDTPTQRIDAFDFDVSQGSLSGRRPLVEIAAEAGAPDGMCVDAEGHLWVALWGGGSVRRYDSSGTLEAIVEVPVRQVTSCCFGGRRLDTLYITTARYGLSPDELTDQPRAGSVFEARPGVRGLSADVFRA